MTRFASFLTILLLTGCAAMFGITTDAERQAYYDAHPDLPERVQVAMEEHRVLEGMTTRQVRLALGHPTKQNRTTFRGTEHTQWVYVSPMNAAERRYVYFDDGRVVGWQNLPNQ